MFRRRCPSPLRSGPHCADNRHDRTGRGCARSGGPCQRPGWVPSSVVVDDAAELGGGSLLLLLPHCRGRRQVVRHVGMVGGLALIAAPPLLEQLAPSLPQSAVDRAQRVQAGLDLVVRRRDRGQIIGRLLVMAGGFPQLVGHHVDLFCHPLPPWLAGCLVSKQASLPTVGSVSVCAADLRPPPASAGAASRESSVRARWRYLGSGHRAALRRCPGPWRGGR